MFETLPILITAYYSIGDALGIVRFAGDNDDGLLLTVIPERDSAATYQFRGDLSSPKMEVRDKDVFIFIARREMQIVASQIVEVDFALAICNGCILIPRGGYNILMEQESIDRDDFPYCIEVVE